MKVCDVVLNSVWYDPRVIKQLSEYNKYCDLCVVGLDDKKSDKNEINKLPGSVNIVPIERKYYRENRTILTKIVREYLIFKRVRDAIVLSGANVIHANDLNALVPAYFASKKLKSYLIYDTHEIFLENHNICNSLFKRLFWSTLEKTIIRQVDKVVCVSHAAAEYIEKKYNISSPLVVTNCSKTYLNFKAKEKSHSYFEVLNHGQFYGGRGYDLMIDAAKLCRNDKNILFVLRGYGEMEDELRKEVEREKLDNVRFDPPVKVYELISQASSSMVGIAVTEPVCLNFELSVSNKLFEYAAAGLPVIMSSIPEHIYLNQKYNIGIVIEENSGRAILEAVRYFLNNKTFYEQCVKNVLEMSKELNWESEFKKLINFEEELIKNG